MVKGAVVKWRGKGSSVTVCPSVFVFVYTAVGRLPV